MAVEQMNDNYPQPLVTIALEEYNELLQFKEQLKDADVTIYQKIASTLVNYMIKQSGAHLHMIEELKVQLQTMTGKKITILSDLSKPYEQQYQIIIQDEK